MDTSRLLVFVMIVAMSTIILFAVGEKLTHEYVNVTGKVIDKYDEEYYTMIITSTGKTTSCIPVYHHDFYLITDQGKVEVNSSIYEKYNNGSFINLTKDLNTSSIELNEV